MHLIIRKSIWKTIESVKIECYKYFSKKIFNQANSQWAALLIYLKMELRYRHRKHFVVLDICGIVCDQNVVQNEVLKQIGLGKNPPQPKLKLA